MKRHFLALLSATYLLIGCEAEPKTSLDQDQTQQAGLGWNGLGWNGLGWNGLGWNGLGWNGLGWNGLGWNGLGWNGLGWNGIAFSNTSVPTDWGLNAWINAPGISAAEREARLSGLAYWTGCACASTDNVRWRGNNPATPGVTETRYFRGNFNLAPTWCRGTGTVPIGEQQAVSACLISRVNTQGVHNALSMRGMDDSLKLGDNEKLFMAYPEGQFWGNIWDEKKYILNPVTGAYYANPRAFACYFPDAGGLSSSLNRDLQIIIGRDCEWGGCDSHLKTTNLCNKSGSIDGAYSQAYADAGLSVPITPTSDPAQSYSGLNRSSLNSYQDVVSGTENTQIYGKSFRQMSIFLGAWADLEIENWKDGLYQCDSTCGTKDGCTCYDSYCRGGEGSQYGEPLRCETPGVCNNCQTIVRADTTKCGASAACKSPTDCVRGRKLVELDASCWINIQFTRPWDLLTGAYVSGNANPHKAGTLTFRYSNGTPSDLSIQIRDQIRSLPIPGSGFATTDSWDKYAVKSIYPIYPGRTTFGSTVPAIEIAIAGAPGSTFPHLDYAQLFVGPPMGVSPRELYWNTKPIALDPKAPTCTKITVDATTDFATANFVRILPQLSGVDISAVKVYVTHGDQTEYYKPSDSKEEPLWSSWMESFFDHAPSREDWVVCVDSGGAKGSLDAVYLEFQQK